ncbi:MAG: hypothetical protein IPL28_07345 [Chloroflexi bacterium]|nr:hypothetical protein [Chloroflexota bacterium]
MLRGYLAGIQDSRLGGWWYISYFDAGEQGSREQGAGSRGAEERMTNDK